MSTSLGALRAASTPQLKAAQAKRLREAAEIIANAARGISGKFSKRIPASIKIIGGTAGMWITAGGPDGKEAPNAYPFEDGVRHPLFGLAGDGRPGDRAHGDPKKGHWYPQPKRPFLEEAAEATAEEAAEAFSAVIDDWCKTLNL
jgi:hypothetical protein